MSRLRELDSLRGLAAVAVVLSHFDGLWFATPSFPRWGNRLHTLLAPLFSGHQAVLLFFVLSGFVLALPFENGKPQTYSIFLIRRITRIYGPYLGGIALAIAGCSIWHGNLHRGAWIAAIWAHPPTLPEVLKHLAFLGIFNVNQFDPPIWSLVHEMRISLIFPALWLLTAKLGTARSLALPLFCSIAASFWAFHQPRPYAMSLAETLHYIGFFVLGILLARHYRNLLPRGAAAQAALAACSAILYFYGMFFAAKLLPARMFAPLALILAEWIVVFGAAGLVLSAIASPRLLHFRFPLFAGRISYALYLVHLTVLMILAFVAGNLSPWLQLPIYLVASLAAASLFCFYVEEPITQWGRRITSRPQPIAVVHPSIAAPKHFK